ncbi:transglycosylase SLT domain-containing protein [Streptomyces sp. DSM 44917]|uniref:Transglycosylase SLT domain-containing protein n=2 Tax=Streptomyces boetiae TaxID=3075541 RepID=A0ABU2LFJ3_9ACTN|nr:transglycosylase SLT domain-containing protein [Streptomyces sp. DSM 44917]MDT0310271.1 transglycosylase SLT domain-containing protein [Streptomyces sp. DSM 44917]
MTATKTTPTTPTTRRVRVAGLVAASAAAVTASLTLVPQAQAAEPTAGQVAQATDAPAAFTAQGQALGKAPASQDEDPAAEDKPEPKDEAKDDAAPKDETEDASEPESEATGDGRGAEYDEQGRLIPIAHDEQPDPVPADDEDIERWINEALEIMDEHDIPGTYEGIHRNLMRESSGDPQTINMWDTNAQENIPSKGLLQVIDPTFDTYHVEGTPEDPFDPVANIVAACNYAADRYGSMDNVNSAY